MRRIGSNLALVMVIALGIVPAHAEPPPLAPPFASASVVDPFCYRVVEGVTRCSPEATAEAASGRSTFTASISGTGEVTVDTVFRTGYTQKSHKPATITFTVDVTSARATRSLFAGHAQLLGTFTLLGDGCACGSSQTVPVVSTDGTATVDQESFSVTLSAQGTPAGPVSVIARFSAFAATDGGVDESRIDADITISDVRAA